MLKIFAAYADFVLAKPKSCLLIALVLFFSCVYLSKDVGLNNQFAGLFTINNDSNQYREFFRQAFGADDATLIAIIKPKVVDDAFFTKLAQLTQQLSQNQDFEKVYSPTNTPVIWSEHDEVFIDPLFQDASLSIKKQLQLLRQSPLTAGRLISMTQDSFAVIAQMPASYNRFDKVEAPAEYFQQLVLHYFDTETHTLHFAGMAYTRVGILKFMMHDLRMLVPLTTVVVCLFMFYLFRLHLVVFISLLASLFAVAATLALIGVNRDDVNQLTLTFPILLMVIVVANTVHFFHRYFSEIELGKTHKQAIFITTQRIGIASLLSCFTTTIGFYTLMTANMPVLFSFGFYLGTGVMFSFVGVMLIIPPILLLKAPKAKRRIHKQSLGFIDNMTAWIIQPMHRKLLCVVGMILLVISSYLGYLAKYDYFLSDMLQKNHPQTIANHYMDKNFSGSLPLEISLLGTAQDFKQPDNLYRMQQLERWLSEHTSNAHWLDIASFLQSIHYALTQESTLPNDKAAIEQLLLLGQSGTEQVLSQLVNDDFSHARMRATITDIGAAELMQLRANFEQYAQQVFQDTDISVRMTGELPVYYEGMNQITTELIRSVLFALVLVVLTIWAVFRDIRLALASVFPNILPIVTGLACYTLLGEAINPLPAIALCIGIGIAVDDTVHLFARFKEELATGKSINQSVLDAMHEIKGAIVSTSVILTVGFLIFLFSSFKWNQELGILGAILISLALIADLILTPAILSLQPLTKNHHD